MFRFIVRAFAVIGFLLVALIVAGFAAQSYQKNQAAKEPDSVILVLNFDQPIVEQDESSPLSLALNPESEATTVLDILRALDTAKDDPHVKGIVARFGATEPSLAEAQDILAALKRFRASGKFTYAFGSDYGEFGLGNRAYYLASAFENIWLQPVGTVSLTGLAMFAPFGKTALDKIGVTADFMQREEYKSFMDMGERDSFAPPVRANMQALVDDLADQEAKDIADNRHWDVAQVKDLMAKGPYTDEESLKAGLVTHIGYADDLDEELKKKAPDAKDVGIMTYLGYDAATASPAKPKAKIALIFGNGIIMDHEVGGVDQVTGENVLGADKISAAFDAAAHDKSVKAILFRIDSPGGSPAASETIRRAMIHAQKLGKPVFVSMGDVAASGGYWIAMNADAIIAEPGTLTGSIGVVSGKFTGKELMQKLGVSVDAVRTADNAGMWMPTDQFTPAQRERVNALLDSSYRAFTQNVAAARKIPLEKMPDVAKGRVWTGQQAVKVGLVDELGGYATTLAAIRKKLGLGEKDLIDLQVYPPPESALEKIEKLLRSLGIDGDFLGSNLNTLRQLQATLAPFAAAMDNTRSPTAARMPNVMIK